MNQPKIRHSVNHKKLKELKELKNKDLYKKAFTYEVIPIAKL